MKHLQTMIGIALKIKKNRRFPLIAHWYDDKTTSNTGYSLPESWYRYSIRLHENNGVSKIILWSNKQTHVKYKFLKSMIYDYDNNMKLRRNDNYIFFLMNGF